VRVSRGRKPGCKAHPGTGSLADAGAEDTDTASGSAAYAKELLERAVDPAGTAAEMYLRSGAINGALPPRTRFVPNARIGEGALVGVLSSRGRTAGAQLIYLDPDGRKSTILPVRRRLMLERAPDAVFETQCSRPGVLDFAFDTLIAEGVEDAYHWPNWAGRYGSSVFQASRRSHIFA
jgi:hypothetical protein